jgi:peptidase inhibitor family I36
MRKASFTLAAAIGILGVVGMSPLATAEDVTSNAPQAAFNVFEHDDQGGRGAAITRDMPNLANVCWPGGGCATMNDNISSMDNNLNRDVVMWSNANYGGIPYYAQPNSEDDDLTNNNFDNRASSIDIR